MNRRRSSSLAASPLLIGALTTLIVVVAVYLSYTANNGLPFVPTYNIKVQLPQASGLTPSNQVRIGGKRVGVVSSMKPYENPRTGRVTAIANLKLEKKVEPLPADTKAEVLSVSSIGLKYLELEKGSSRRTIKAGHVIPVSQTTEPVDFESLFNMFDKKTRTAIKINTVNFGNGLAGRGRGLNNTIAELRPLVTNAIPVLHNLAAPATELKNLFPALDRVAAETAPVAETNAEYFVSLDTFFAAWASVARSLEEATVGGPPSLEQAIFSLPREAPFNEKATEFMHLLRPSAKDLITVAPQLAHAFTVGAVNLNAAQALNDELAESSKALAEFGQNPVVTLSLEGFTQFLDAGNPLLAGVAPEQANCNYWTLAFRNIASLESESVGIGTIARAGFKLAPTGPNNEGFPSSAPANGPSTELAANRKTIIDNNHLHFNPYPNVTGPGQANVCEAGNENYVAGQAVIGHAASSASSREFTTREQNLFGAPYSEATLKALGISKGKTK
jgi:MlaD protein